MSGTTGTTLLPSGLPLTFGDRRRWTMALGAVPAFAAPIKRAPWLHDGLLDLLTAPLPTADVWLAAKVLLVVARSVHCRFCYGAARAMLAVQGLDEAAVRKIEEDLATPDAPGWERAALRHVAAVVRPGPTGATVAELRALGTSDERIAEFSFMAVRAVFTTRLTLQVRPPPLYVEGMAAGWLKPLRPLMRAMFTTLVHPKGKPALLADRARQGPLAECVSQLDGTPGALVLCKLVDAAFADAALQPGERALVLAVTAKALEDEVQVERWTQAAVELGIGEASAVVDALGGPQVSDDVAELLGLARAAVRPEARDVQERSERLLQKTSPERYVGAIGLVALANAVLAFRQAGRLREGSRRWRLRRPCRRFRGTKAVCCPTTCRLPSRWPRRPRPLSVMCRTVSRRWRPCHGSPT